MIESGSKQSAENDQTEEADQKNSQEHRTLDCLFLDHIPSPRNLMTAVATAWRSMEDRLPGMWL
jgi:hypothetical protein